MSTIPSLPKDLKIDIKDSCNSSCRCFRMVKENTPLYINSKGEAVKWDRKKVLDRQESMQRCLANLDRRIQEIAAKAVHNTESVYQSLHEEIFPSLSEKEIITLEEIEFINKRIQSFFI